MGGHYIWGRGTDTIQGGGGTDTKGVVPPFLRICASLFIFSFILIMYFFTFLAAF